MHENAPGVQDDGFFVGIDLGTTHCALASVPRAHPAAPAPAPAPLTLPIPQVTAAGETMALPLLPSFLYLPAAAEFPPNALALPWDAHPDRCAGVFARNQGQRTPGRLVSSAKSWLSFAGANRRDGILPWGGLDDVPRVSPVAAAAHYLSHLREAWDAAHPGAPLAAQDVVLTVPASFDPVARELTVEAAHLAGFGASLRLLEEPQAAMYAYVAARGAAWRRDLHVGDVVLVCDIGGGTTDFSLIAVEEDAGALALRRIAVGDHILLGGDNMDLALAYAVRARLQEEGQELDEWQMRVLTHGCREAKEALLSTPERSEEPLVIPGRSSRLIQGSLRTTLSREVLEGVVLDGFFPLVDAGAEPSAPRRSGFATRGLPYATDAAITRHLSAFLSRPSLPRGAGHSFVHPTAILFNGGVTRSAAIRQRLHACVGSWIKGEGVKAEEGQAPVILSGIDADTAVSRGAAFYARQRHQGGVRIRGGTAQAYYIGVERTGLAVPGVAPALDAVCIAPFGMEEGAEVELAASFALIVGEPVSFRFFASSQRRDDALGAVVAPGALTELSPVETTLDGTPGESAHVRLNAHITSVGTLELAAVALEGENRWKLSFDVRLC